jgi:hypothetical protein
VPDRMMRNAVLDTGQVIPSQLNVLYWIHPYPHILVIRDVVMPAVRGVFTKFGMFSILKYFPVGYVVTDLKTYEGLDSLSFYLSGEIDREEEIPLNLRGTRHAEWPEMIDPGNMIIGGQSLKSAVSARPRVRAKAKSARQATSARG